MGWGVGVSEAITPTPTLPRKGRRKPEAAVAIKANNRNRLTQAGRINADLHRFEAKGIRGQRHVDSQRRQRSRQEQRSSGPSVSPAGGSAWAM